MKLNIISTRAYKYPGETSKQDRFFEIYPEKGAVEVAVNPEIGNAVPMRVWDGLVLRFEIPTGYTRKDIQNMYSENRTLFARVIAGWETIWNGTNYVGRLTADAKAASDELDFICYNS